ncbi:MAG: hypothetical protein HND40_13170 [Ignavibacteriota bacterium]|nr:hypothetical protein [Ignavibacteriota bacterium]MCO6448015.1 hypothetical protein [Ignavibacterium album]QKK00452.1 MAG: hypothetical protein HND40_13170 [Ignavibacteriota bacterium]HOJ08406.1 hypothetical protein [Ignavibacteriaceae bacterium]
MKKHKLIFLLILVSIFLLITNCNSTEPPDDELKPGRRDYTWTVDTLPGLYTPRLRMWGSSPTDIWATSPSNWIYSISQFNGENWVYYGVSGINQPNAIYGFSSNNVFIGDENGKIWNGPNWKLFAQIQINNNANIVFSNMWGESPTDFYAVGGYPDSTGGFNGSVLVHYNVDRWSIIDIREMNGIIAKLYKNYSDNKIYLLAYKTGNGLFPDSSIIYEYYNEKFTKIYSSIWTGGKQSDISIIDKEVYFVLGNQIAKRVNNLFQTFLQVNSNNFYQRIWGRNSKDIFLLMTDGLAHYNGTDIEYLFYFNKTPRTQIYGVALFDKDAFFLVYEGQTGLSFVYHGKLN